VNYLEIRNPSSLSLLILSIIIIISDIADMISMTYLIQSLVKELGQVEPDPGEVRPEPENPEEPGPGDESELIEDDNEFDVVDGIDDDDL
jgi:hypothetical protein